MLKPCPHWRGSQQVAAPHRLPAEGRGEATRSSLEGGAGSAVPCSTHRTHGCLRAGTSPGWETDSDAARSVSLVSRVFCQYPYALPLGISLDEHGFLCLNCKPGDYYCPENGVSTTQAGCSVNARKLTAPVKPQPGFKAVVLEGNHVSSAAYPAQGASCTAGAVGSRRE